MTTTLPAEVGKLLGSVGENSLHQIYNQNAAPVDAVPTMLPNWNRLCRDEGGGVGLAHGWHVIVGGKTGSGKSLFGLGLAVAAIKRGYKVGFVSLEMSHRQLVTRALSILSGVPVAQLEPGPDYSEEAFQRAARLWVDGAEHMMYVNEVPIHTLSEIEDAITRAHETEGVRYFVTDYLQLAWASKADTITAQITEVSHAIRGIAQELKVVSVGLSQYNRETSKSKERPEVTGLMGGSSLENDADQVILLDHTKYKQTSKNSATQEILLSKNRHGSSGRLAVAWDYKTLTVSELQEEMNNGRNDAWEPDDETLPF